MFGLFAVIFAVLATINVSYLSYWDEKRIFVHLTPYIFVGISVILFSVEFGQVQWLGVAILVGSIGGLHIVSFFSGNLKK